MTKSDLVILFSLVTFIAVTSMFMSGCSTKPLTKYEPTVITHTEVVTEYIPVVEPRPQPDCDFAGTPTETVHKLLDCVILQKRIIGE